MDKLLKLLKEININEEYIKYFNNGIIDKVNTLKWIDYVILFIQLKLFFIDELL